MMVFATIMATLTLWVFVKYPSNKDVRKRESCRNSHPSHGTE